MWENELRSYNIYVMRSRNGQFFYVFDEDATEELLDFQDTFSDCMDTLIEALENLKDAVLSIDVPNIERSPEPEWLPEPEPEQFPELENDLPF